MGFEIRAWLILFCAVLVFGNVQSYNRPPPRDDVHVNKDNDDDASPEQVHVSLAGEGKMRISWMTKSKSTEAIVDYGLSPGAYTASATGKTSTYRYIIYKSGAIHEVVIGPLKPNTAYNYRCGGATASSREFNFKTPPSQFPIKFAVAGDLGQTGWTKTTLEHISKSKYDILILPGDLSYADFYQPKWDSFGRLVEPLASQRPWMVTQGNHEVEKIPIIQGHAFRAYNARWPMPHEESGSASNLYYSFDSFGVHFIMLGSYTDFGPGSEQFRWLQADLGRIDRTKTPWVAVVVHAPWYNTNKDHRGENEADDMKKAMEDLIYRARVDVVFAGHVHAYERFTRVYNAKLENCGPIYITIGDGGNREGLATKYDEPKPEISMFREASFGHGQFNVVNASHALWTWHRNDDDVAVASDSLWITSHSSNSECKL